MQTVGSMSLTPAQRQAVTHDGAADGPLIVLAGPGTGKTRVITGRIAHLIRERGAAPESVLAVTFTVKAAEEMRRRLADLLADERGLSVDANAVQLGTFHSIAYRLVRRFADMAGFAPIADGGLIDAAQRKRLVRSLVRQHTLFPSSLGPGLDGGGGGGVVEEACRVLGRFGDLGIEPGEVTAFVGRWGALLREGKDSAGNELDKPGLAAERVHHARFVQCAKLYELYDAHCRRHGVVALSDLIVLATRVLKRSADAAAIVRSEFRHVLVDEFQDVNRSQIELLRAIAPPAHESETSATDVCVVGDDDQAIYGFRGADPKALAHFAAIWGREGRSPKVVRLEDNFRSVPSVVGVSQEIISRAHERFDPEKTLRAAGREDADGRVECVHAEPGEDTNVIAAMILADKAEHPERKWSGYAVVVRGTAALFEVADTLRLEGVPVRVSRGRSPMSDPGVQDLWAWMDVLRDPSSTWAARRLLMRPPVQAPAERLIAWEKAYAGAKLRERVNAAEQGRSDDEPRAYLLFVAELLKEEVSDDASLASRVAKLSGWFAELRELAPKLSAAEMLQRIITLTDLAHHDLPDARLRAERVSALVRVLALARSKERALDEPRDIAAFRAYLDDLDERDWEWSEDLDDKLDANEAGADGDMLDENGEGGGGGGAVEIRTAHKAKGLEFDTVFVPRVQPTKGGYGSSGFPGTWLPPALEFGAPLPAAAANGNGAAGKQQLIDEERRILYVACTRAQRRLVLLSKKNKTPSKSTHFFEELTRGVQSRHVSLVRDADEVFGHCAESAGRLGWSGGGDELSRATASVPRGAGGRKDVAEEVRREARLVAAGALDTLECGEEAYAVRLHAATPRLRLAAELLMLADAASRGVPIGEWPKSTDEDPVFARAHARLAAARDADAALHAGGSSSSRWEALTGHKVKPPLRLSYSHIRTYLECPRCYMVRHVLGLPESSGGALMGAELGSAVHKALEKFYRELRDAEADGRPAPTRDDLVRFGREGVRGLISREGGTPGVSADDLDRVAEQLGMAYDRLHNAHAEVLEVERQVRFAYSVDGREHTIDARIDRVDRIDGGFALVDYKTGLARKDLREPKPDDLQLGIYRLALESWFAAEGGGGGGGGGGEDPAGLAGVAEYWVLSSGERGSIRLEDLRLDKVRAKIDQAVRGILAGEFPQACKGAGDCGFLGDDQ